MNFRTLTQPDPGVSRLSLTKVHELSDEQIARQPGRLKQSKAGSPARGEPADAEQVASAKARTPAAEQVGPNEDGMTLPHRLTGTQRGPPQMGRADAVQVACAKARVRLAEQVGPKEEGIGLAAMPDE